MKIILRILLLVFIPPGTYSCYKHTSGYDNISSSPIKVILDTDIDPDVDDVGVLDMLLNLHKAGSIHLIGIIVTSDDPFVPVCVGSINTFYGFPEILIGFIKDQTVLTNFSRYTRQIASEFPSVLKKWICMGGQFPKSNEANFCQPDPQLTIFCVGNWQREVAFCGWEAGNKLITGGSSLKGKLNSEHPLYRDYELYL